MEPLTFEWVFTYIVMPLATVAGTAVAGVWFFYTRVIAPSRIGQQGDAFKQVLSINETLITTFINGLDKTAEAITGLKNAITEGYNNVITAIQQLEKTINTLEIIKTVGNMKTQTEISNRERARLEEIISDIDIELHEIKALLSQINDRQS